ncbi:smoothelin-like protein 1 [Xenopus laevis]|uniref:Smoothelin-like protein 1 n=2 Tax=Xenopus laevis TaxID=8355 RepID=A0A1L8ERG0_XENLA|nr:smoothelin-like protein 1 [Xenopus laevis]OCT61849.1 hypothetical protein XELAEV_18047879mg [Xenopus laevis]
MGNSNAKNASDIGTDPPMDPMSTALYQPHLSPVTSPTRDSFYTPPVSPEYGPSPVETGAYGIKFDYFHKGLNSILKPHSYEKGLDIPFDRAIKRIQQALETLGQMQRQLGELLNCKTNIEVPRILDSAHGWEARIGDVWRDLRAGLRDLANLKEQYMATSKGEASRTDLGKEHVTDNHRDNQIESERREWKREEQRLRAELQERSKLLQEFSNKLKVLESKQEDENGDKKRLQDHISLLEKEKEKMGRKVTELQGSVEELTLLQSDLRTAVSVAERFREEAQQKLEKAEKENQRLHSQEAQEEDFKAPPTVNGSSLGYRSLPRGVTLNSTGETALKTRSVSPSNGQETDSEMWHKEKRRGSLETLQYQPRPIENLTSDSVSFLRRYGGSKRGVFLRWAQERTCGYKYVVITNFSSSWVDGMAFCALLHSYLPDSIPYSELRPLEKRKNLELAFEVAEDQDIPPLLTSDHMLQRQGPDWQKVLLYVEFIYQKFEA